MFHWLVATGSRPISAVDALHDRLLAENRLALAAEHEGKGLLGHRGVSHERLRAHGDPPLTRCLYVDVLAVQPVFLDVSEFTRRADDGGRQRRLVAEDSLGLGREGEQGVLFRAVGRDDLERRGGCVRLDPAPENGPTPRR